MTEKHYENFPVASLMLPRRLRKPVSLIYAFARAADDFADEGDLADDERIRLLGTFRLELDRISGGIPPESALFRELAVIIEQYGLPVELFSDLLDAFTQDVGKKRYADFAELMDYCSKSANPVGRLLIQLYGIDSASNREYSDKICSSLQLINFLQDVEIDFKMGRIYLPMNEKLDHGITESGIASQEAGASWAKFMAFQTGRARRMMLEGAPLAQEMGGRLGLEMKMIIHGGLRILERIDAVQGDVFRHRPKLGRADWMHIMLRAFVSPAASGQAASTRTRF